MHRISIVLLLLGLAACSPAQSSTSPPRTIPASTTPPPPTAPPTTESPPVSTPPDTDLRRPVILDYSPTVSDLGALVFLASRPELRLVAVTLPGTGESHCEAGVAHTRGVLERLGLGQVPVACGPEDPLTGWNAFPTSWRVASDEMDLPEAPPNETRDAPSLIADLVRSESQPVHVVAVGPLTNLAVALRDHPDLSASLGGITVMGGAVDVPGNVFRNDVAEWNIWVDPTAAGAVFASGVPVTLVPLDATNHLPTSAVFFAALQAAAGSPAADLLLSVWENSPEWQANEQGFFYFWDELAAAVLTDETLVTFATVPLVVDDDLRENKGWTRRDPSGVEVRVAVTADRRAFEELFLETIAGHPVTLGYLEATPAEIAYFEALAAINAGRQRAIDDVFAATAADLGLPPEPSDEEFVAVLGAALPAIFDEVMGPYTAELAALPGPPALNDLHAGYAAAWEGLYNDRADLIASFNEMGSFDVFAPFFEVVETACRALRDAAAERLLGLDLVCSG